MHTEKIFKTKTGYCQIFEDKIVLTRNGVAGNLAKTTIGNNIIKPLLIYGFISLVLFFLAFKSYNEGKIFEAVFSLIFGLLLIFAILKSLNNSATPVINREDIKEIEFKKAVQGISRSYFIVHFKNEKKQLKQRLILLPGSLNNGQVETEKALEIMTSEFQNIKM